MLLGDATTTPVAASYGKPCFRSHYLMISIRFSIAAGKVRAWISLQSGDL